MLPSSPPRKETPVFKIECLLGALFRYSEGLWQGLAHRLTSFTNSRCQIVSCTLVLVIFCRINLHTRSTPKFEKAIFIPRQADISRWRYSYYTGRPLAIRRILQTATMTLGKQFTKWKIEVNPSKTAVVLFSSKRQATALPPSKWNTWVCSSIGSLPSRLIDRLQTYRPSVVSKIYCL